MVRVKSSAVEKSKKYSICKRKQRWEEEALGLQTFLAHGLLFRKNENEFTSVEDIF